QSWRTTLQRWREWRKPCPCPVPLESGLRRAPAPESQAGNDVGAEYDREQHERGRPGLAVPVVVRSDGVREDHDGEGRGGLQPAGTPVAVAEGGEEKRCGLARDAGEREEEPGQDAAH